MLKPDEPAASVVREAFEGFASGRFETQADVMRFLQGNPLFPKDSSGIVRNMRVTRLLSQSVYAGYVEEPRWGVSLRAGQHEALIDFTTFQKVQDRLNGNNRLPNRRNLNEDFPLRGFVQCGDCGTPLTACWSKGLTNKYPYYLCPKRGCQSYGKSIRREKIEGEFEGLLKTIQPTETLFKVAHAMFEELWEHRRQNLQAQRSDLQAHLISLEREVQKFLARIVDASAVSVVAAYEARIEKLEAEKVLTKERLERVARPTRSFDETLRTALDFVANPWNLWASRKLEDQRTVLKLTFADRLAYVRDEGFRTAKLSLPFKVIGSFLSGERVMARPKRFELLAF